MFISKTQLARLGWHFSKHYAGAEIWAKDEHIIFYNPDTKKIITTTLSQMDILKLMKEAQDVKKES